MIQRGSIVRLGPKWSKQEERHLLYGVREYYEDTGKCEIKLLEKCNLNIRTIITTTVEMLVDTGLTVEKDILPFDTEKNYMSSIHKYLL